jgi:hypothetical protein
MHRFDNSQDPIERDPKNDQRSPSQTDGEVVVERKPIVADRPRTPDDPRTLVGDRRRGERRRIERMGTDI